MEINRVAELCHEVNRAYCTSIGDYSQLPWSESPEWQKESAVNGVVYHLTNDTSPEQSHVSWIRHKRETGWQYGPKKSEEHKTHPCMVDYINLPPEQRSKDYIFKAICDFYKDNPDTLTAATLKDGGLK